MIYKSAEQRILAETLADAAHSMDGVQGARFSFVWPTDDSDSGFVVTLADGRQFEVLIRERR